MKVINGISILILDDDAEWIALHSNKLQEVGYTCKSTPKAEEALEFIKQDKKRDIKAAIIDEILLDPDNPIMKQDKQGSDIAKEIRKIRDDILLIMVSAAPEKEKITREGLELSRKFEEITNKVFYKFELQKNYEKLTNYLAKFFKHNEFTKEGEYWSITFAGKNIKLKDCKGLQYIFHLISNPNKAIPSIMLCQIVQRGDFISSNPSTLRYKDDNIHDIKAIIYDDILDIKAINSYKKRLSEIEVEIDEACRNNDIEKVSQLEKEKKQIKEELSQSLDKRGRSRKFTNEEERARQAISKAINRSLDKIKENHKELSKHLSNSLRLGRYNSYSPQQSTYWKLSKE